MDQIERVTVERVPTLGGVDLIRARFGPRSSFPHWHESVEIGVVCSGRRAVRCRGLTFPAPAGSLVVFEDGEVHWGAACPGVGAGYRSFLIPRQVFLRLCGRPAPGWFTTPVIHDPQLARRLAAIHRVFRLTTGGPAEQRIGPVLGELALRYWRDGNRLEAGGARPRGDPAVRAIRSYLETHCTEPVRLSTLAELAGRSVRHTVRAFRAAHDLPPYAWLAQLRVHRAQRLLVEGQPVSRVAYLTGFSDQSHLTRFFKRLVGVPPGRYRRSALRALREIPGRGPPEPEGPGPPGGSGGWCSPP